MESTSDNFDIETAQQDYFNAVSSGDKDRIKEQEEKINQYLNSLNSSNNNDEQNEKVLDKSQDQDNTSQEDSAVTNETSLTEGGEKEPNKAATQTTDGSPQPSAAVDPNEWINSLDENLRPHVLQLLQERQSWEQRYRSDEGRIRAAQQALIQADKTRREYERLKKEYDQVQQKSPVTNNEPASKPAASATTDDFDGDPDIRALKETDEQLYRVIQKLRQRDLKEIQALKTELDTRLQSSIQPLEEYRQETHLERELSRLTEVVPNAVDILRHPAWEEWKQGVPDQVRQLADSDNHRDVLYAMQLYGQWAQQFSQQPTEQKEKAGVTQQPVQHQQQQQAQKTNPAVQQFVAERNRKLQATPVGSQSIKPPTRSKPSESEILNNPELLAQEQERIFKEELKRMGLA